jgi:sulfur carrier protein
MPLYDARAVLVPSCPAWVLQGRIRHHTETHARIEVVIELVINGEPRRFPAPLTLSQLIASLDLAGKRIAIEKNGEIVPRSQHASTELASGDRLEIVVAVGGG